MRFNNLFFIFILMFSISVVYASISYEEENQTYIIDTWVPTWLGGNGESTVKLIDNTDQCLIDCSFTIEGYNEEPVNLIDDIEFKGRDGNDVSSQLQSINFQIGTYQNVTIEEPIYEEICEEVQLTENNSTNQTLQNCYQEQTGINTYEEIQLVWQDYNGEDVEGYYLLEADAKKSKISMDWIITMRGEELTEWAWWDSDWIYKREITLTATQGNLSYMNISYYANMNINFSDVRFLDNTEAIELNYTVETKEDGEWAIFRINNLGETNFYMYYGNSLASSVSNASKLYFEPVSLYYFDNNANDYVGNNNATPSGVTLTNGYIYNGYNFDGSDTIDLNNGFLDTYFTKSLWMKFNGGSLTNTQTLFETRGPTVAQFGYTARFEGGSSRLAFGGDSTSYARQQIYYFSSMDVLDGNWHFMTFVANPSSSTNDASDYSLYIDGEFQSPDTFFNYGTAQTYPYASPDDLVMGTNFVGDIDEVYVHDYVLTPIQIYQLYTQTEPTFTIGAEQQHSGSASIQYITPPTLENGTNWSETYIPVQVNVTYDNATLDNITFDFYKGGVLNQSYFFTNETYSVNATSCLCDNWQFNVTLCYTEDILNSSSCVSTETRTVIIDVRPPEINISSPVSLYNFLYTNKQIDLNWTVTDNIAGVDNCWYQYNNVNQTVNCSDNHTIFNYTILQNYLIFYSNDTFGNLGFEYVNWSGLLSEIGVEYDAITIDTSTESFMLNISRDPSITSINAILHYENISQASSIISSGNNVTFSNEFTIPAVENDTNNTFYWDVFYTNSTGSFNISTPVYTQFITEIAIVSCVEPIVDGLSLNFTTYDSLTYQRLNSSLEADFQYFSEQGDGSVSKTYSFADLSENTSQHMFCVSTNDANLTIDATISYYATDYDRREYMIFNGEIGNYTQNIPLYLAPTNLTDIVTISVIDEYFNPLEDAFVKVQQWDIGTGSYYTIGTFVTDGDGKGIINLKLYDVWYRFIIQYQGVIVKTTEPTKLASSTKQIQVNLGGENPYETFGDITHSLTYSNVSFVASFVYSDTSGYTQNGCMKIVNNTASGDEIIYDSCVESTAGILSTTVSDNGTYIAYGLIELNSDKDNVYQVVDTEIIQIGTSSAYQTQKGYGQVIAYLLIGTSVALGAVAGSIPLGLGLIVLSVWAITKMGWLNIYSTIFWAIVSIVLILLSRLSRRNG